jgi:sugar transferase EpsL
MGGAAAAVSRPGSGSALNRRQRAAKRAFDLVVALPLTLVALPVMAAVAAVVRVALGSPVLFRQQRPGLHGRPFTLVKFRTMTDGRDAEGRLLPDSARLGRVGRFLRSTSLDELPELLNVLRGDMSLVGPRPLLVQYLDRYTADQHRRHEVPPGVTGWTAVKGRNALSWDEKFALDVWYVDHWSVWLDVKILVLTLRAALGRHGVSAPGSVTTQEFVAPPAEPGDAP